ncbi:MAG: hypothetical protein PHD37_06000 [Gallionellaceae bacterium]|nr:hypothetical protein [Gallionellaceae bacterium]
MNIPEVPPPRSTPPQAGNSSQITISEAYLLGEVATLLAGLERQKEELGPIADELIDLLHHLGVGKPPPQVINPSNE